jgi:GGDEF domain-containing protein
LDPDAAEHSEFLLLFTVVMSAIAVKTVGKLRKERDIDALTQILNRRPFQEHAQKRLDMRRYPMAVLACDIDHFKRINDAWGTSMAIWCCNWFLD